MADGPKDDPARAAPPPESPAAEPEVVEKALGALQKVPAAGDRPIINFFGNVTIVVASPPPPPPSPSPPPPPPPSRPWWQVSLLVAGIAAVLAFVVLLLAVGPSAEAARLGAMAAILFGAVVFAVVLRMNPASMMRRMFWAAVVLAVGAGTMIALEIELRIGGELVRFTFGEDWPILVLLGVIVIVTGVLASKEMDVSK